MYYMLSLNPTSRAVGWGGCSIVQWLLLAYNIRQPLPVLCHIDSQYHCKILDNTFRYRHHTFLDTNLSYLVVEHMILFLLIRHKTDTATTCSYLLAWLILF